jgi:hypothetical protein
VRPEGLCVKNSNDTIGNRTRELPTYDAMPQLTAPPRTLQGVEDEKPNIMCLQPRDWLSIIVHTDKVTQTEQSSLLLLLSFLSHPVVNQPVGMGKQVSDIGCLQVLSIIFTVKV